MTSLETALVATTAAAFLFAGLQTWRLRRLHGAATRVVDRLKESRAALNFIAEAHSYPRDIQFAGAVLDGNDLALRTTFPRWQAFRERERDGDFESEVEAHG